MMKPVVRKYDTRIEMIGSIIQPGFVCAELGVLNGNFAKEILKLNPKLLYLVDLWEGSVVSGDHDGNDLQKYNCNHSFHKVNSLFGILDNVEIFKDDSLTFLNNMPDSHFDFIYIDTTHVYEQTYKELNLAFKKVKNYGYLGGHDYKVNLQKCHNDYSFGVKEAVDKFCSTCGQKVCAEAMDGCVSFLIRINKHR